MWLPVYRIKFTLFTLIYRALAIHQPPYLAGLLLNFSDKPTIIHLTLTLLSFIFPELNWILASMLSLLRHPNVWNELPTGSCESHASFCQNLKTYFFSSKLLFRQLVTPAHPQLLKMINDFVTLLSSDPLYIYMIEALLLLIFLIYIHTILH